MDCPTGILQHVSTIVVSSQALAQMNLHQFVVHHEPRVQKDLGLCGDAS
jgi:hypothetical protein